MIDTLISPTTQRHVTVIETVVGPGGSGGESYYRLPSEFEVCFVLEGSIDVDIEGTGHMLKVGDAVSFDAGTPHTWRNRSDKRGARMLFILAPALPDQVLGELRNEQDL